jgi:hypothetical protein
MWNKMLQSVRDMRVYHDIRNAARAALNNLEQEQKRLEKEVGSGTPSSAGGKAGKGKADQAGGAAPALDEGAILAEFKSLWPQVLAKVHHGEVISIIHAADKVGENQYRCTYHAQSANGDNVRSLECLKKDIKDMKSYLAGS